MLWFIHLPFNPADFSVMVVKPVPDQMEECKQEQIVVVPPKSAFGMALTCILQLRLINCTHCCSGLK